MNAEDAEEYTQALGQVVAGGYRQVALGFRLGVPQALGLSTGEWVSERLGGYVKLTIPERQEAVKELAAEGMSNRQTAAVLGVDEGTVRNDLKPAENSALQTTDAPSDKDGEGLSAENSAPMTTRELLGQSDENEWYTPRRFIEAARIVLGTIDLDPASSETANRIVDASQFYTIHDNGLEQPWKGTVWLNPPYGGENRLFVERLIREYEAGNVTAACALVNCHPAETAWFQRLFAYTVCFVRGRIDFTGPARDKASTSTHGSAIAYLGPDWRLFAKTFDHLGAVVRRAEPA